MSFRRRPRWRRLRIDARFAIGRRAGGASEAIARTPNDRLACLWRRGLAALVLLLGIASPAAAESKLAFVVGIDTYQHLPADAQLQRAVADADAVANALQGLGFTVTRVTQDGSVDKVLSEFDRFTNTIQPGDTALFYYAGHGISLNDGNYLIAGDVPLLGPNDERIAKRYAISEREVKQGLREHGARIAIVVLDACRNNPFPARGTRAIGTATRGLARIDATDGVYSLYSAREGQAALDRLSDTDADPDSVFTRVFVKALKTPGVSLSELGDAVRDDVATLARSVNAEQVPAVSNDLIGARSVYLAGRAPVADIQLQDVGTPPKLPPEVLPQGAIPPPKVPGPDEITWSFIKGTGDASQIEAFLERYPQSTLRGEAEARLAELRRTQVAAVEPQKPTQDQALAQAPPTADPAECDRLAAMSFDGTRPAGLKGVDRPRDVDGPAAVPACRAALARDPDNARLKMQLGIALVASFRPSDAAADPTASPEVVEGTSLLRQAAASGHAAAMMLFGVVSLEMRPAALSDPDVADALGWVRKAAEAGVAPAFGYLGSRYESGRGVTADKAMALDLYRKGAAAGDPQAQTDAERLAKEQPAGGDVATQAPSAPPDPAVAECDRLAAMSFDPRKPDGVAGLEDVGYIDANAAIPACRAALISQPQNLRLKVELALSLMKKIRSRDSDSEFAKLSTEFVKLSTEAAEAGYPLGMWAIGLYGTDISLEGAERDFEWLRKAAESGMGRAQYDLALEYDTGIGTDQDLKQAKRWYKAAAANGITLAQAALTRAKFRAIGDDDAQAPPSPPDPSIAECDRLVALKQDPGRPPEMPGIDIDATVDTLKAISACRAALKAQPDLPRLKMELGLALLMSPTTDGPGSPQLMEALDKLKAAADAGYPAAMAILGMAYDMLSGEAAFKDKHAEALALLGKAADQGIGFAMTALGDVYEKGALGMTADKAQALSWYRKGAAVGDPRAEKAVERLAKEVPKGGDAAIPAQASPPPGGSELVGHSDMVRDLAASPDGKRLASVSNDGTVRLWDLTARTELRRWSTGFYVVRFSPDGRALAFGNNGGIDLVDASSGALIRHFAMSGISCVAFSPDGRLIAAGGSEEHNVIAVWAVANGARTKTLKGNRNNVQSLVFSSDGQRLLSSSSDNSVRVFDVAAGTAKPVVQLPIGAGGVDGAAFAAGGAMIVAGSWSPKIWQWDARTGKLIRSLTTRPDGNHTVTALAPNGSSVASATDDSPIEIRTLKDGTVAGQITGFKGETDALVFAPDGTWIAFAGTGDFAIHVRALPLTGTAGQ